jgi:hypothetical protein
MLHQPPLNLNASSPRHVVARSHVSAKGKASSVQEKSKGEEDTEDEEDEDEDEDEEDEEDEDEAGKSPERADEADEPARRNKGGAGKGGGGGGGGATRSSVPSTSKKSADRDPNMPKRPRTAFFIYSNEIRDKVSTLPRPMFMQALHVCFDLVRVLQEREREPVANLGTSCLTCLLAHLSGSTRQSRNIVWRPFKNNRQHVEGDGSCRERALSRL